MKKRVLCFGDSNTWGYDAKTITRYGEDVRWTGRLQALLGDGYSVIEEGQNGRTTVWDDPVENRLAGLTYLWPCMESQSPFDLIVIMLGTNDAKQRFCVSAKCIAQSAGRLVDMAQKSPFGRDGRAPAVLLVSPILIKEAEPFDHFFGQQAALKSKDFPSAFEEVARTFGCHYLNAAEFAAPCTEDGVHLDEAGHERLALAMCKAIKEIVG